MRVAFGIAGLTVLLSLVTILRIMIDWRIILVVSLVGPIYSIVKNKIAWPRIRITKTTLFFLGALLLFAFTFHMYHTGAFNYDYLEDGDPWIHAGTAKYIAETKTALDPAWGEVFQYIDPYPPGYDAILAILYQTSGDLMWTVKFFNALLISLGILFFFFLANLFLGDASKALFATFILAMIPSYMSHFIWAHTLVILLIFPLFYSLEQIEQNKKWKYLAGVSYAGIMLAQPTQAFKISLLLLVYLGIRMLYHRRICIQHWIAIIGGGVGSVLIWWGPMWIKYKDVGLVRSLGSGGARKGVEGFTLKFWGTADRVYTFEDFFYAKSQNMINNPIGIGLVICLLIGLTLGWMLYKNRHLIQKQYMNVVICFALLLVTFLGVHGARLPVQLWAFRFWMLQAIFVSLFVPIGVWGVKPLLKKMRIPFFIFIGIILVGVVLTSGLQKYAVNTAQWSPSASFVRYGQIDSWTWIKDLPQNSHIYYPCTHRLIDFGILSYGHYMCRWCEEDMAYKSAFVNTSMQENADWLDAREYQYLYIDGNCISDYGENGTNVLMADIQSSGKFAPAHQTQGAVMFKLV